MATSTSYRVNRVPIVISDSSSEAEVAPCAKRSLRDLLVDDDDAEVAAASPPRRLTRRRRKRRRRTLLREQLASIDEVVPETPPHLMPRRRIAASPPMLMLNTPPNHYKYLVATLRKDRSATQAAAVAHFKGETTRQEFAMHFGIVIPSDDDVNQHESADEGDTEERDMRDDDADWDDQQVLGQGDEAASYARSDGDTEGGDQEGYDEEEPNTSDREFIDDSELGRINDESASYAPSESGDSHASFTSNTSVPTVVCKRGR